MVLSEKHTQNSIRKKIITGFEYFDAIYCINLATRKDRWRKSCKEFRKLGIFDIVQKFTAIKKENGALGCLLSHRKIIQEAQEKWYEKILVFEDDIKVIGSQDEIKDFIQKISSKSWGIAYFGAQFFAIDVPVLHTKDGNMYNINGGRGTHAICYHQNVYEEILKMTENSWDFLEKYLAIDRYFWKKLQRKYTTYHYKKPLIITYDSTSDIKKNCNNEICMKKIEKVMVDNFFFWKYLGDTKILRIIITLLRPFIQKIVQLYYKIHKWDIV